GIEFGAGEESRTPDLRITNALLYQLSYAGGTAVALICRRSCEAQYYSRPTPRLPSEMVNRCSRGVARRRIRIAARAPALSIPPARRYRSTRSARQCTTG